MGKALWDSPRTVGSAYRSRCIFSWIGKWGHSTDLSCSKFYLKQLNQVWWYTPII